MEHLTDGYYLFVNMMHFEILINAQVNLYLFDGVIPLVQKMLSFVNLSKSTLSNNLNFFEEPLISILLEVLTELVFICLLFAPKDETLL